MPEIQTCLSITLLLKLITFQLLYVNEKLVKDPRLAEIIEYCIPRKLLAAIYFWAWRGNEIHAKMFISIRPDNTTSSITIEAIGRSGEAVKNALGADSAGPDDRGACPVWTQAIELFTSLCEDNGLCFSWSVGWRDKHEELNEKFGFIKQSSSHQAVKIIDKTVDMPERHFSNSILSELDMTTLFSEEVRSEVTKPKE